MLMNRLRPAGPGQIVRIELRERFKRFRFNAFRDMRFITGSLEFVSWEYSDEF